MATPIPTTTLTPVPPTRSTDGQQPAWQQQMDEARRMAAAGMNYIMVLERNVKGGVFVFYNNPDPFCYTYMIPGEWVKAEEPDAYLSKDGQAFVRVLFLLAEILEGFEGATMVERAGNGLTREYEKSLGHPLAGAELTPFESARSRTWRWRAAPVSQAEQEIDFPVEIIVDLSPDAVVLITVQGTGDDDGLARGIIENLRTTSDPECYFPVLENMLRAAYGDR
jgi:hypothetical protein